MSENETIEETEYLTAPECAKICRYKTSHPIRRAVARGDLPGVRVQQNLLLIPAKAFWTWFHNKDVKPMKPEKLISPPPDIVYVPGNPKTRAHFRIAKKQKEGSAA